jgi:hypothetical protein
MRCSARYRQSLITRFGWLVLSFAMACVPAASRPPAAKPNASNAVPEPAIPAILAAFDRYEVVAMPEAHGMKDIDDLILALIRDPRLPEKVNDIAVECGNSLYQPVLDRYIAGMDVPFAEVRKVWRNTTQDMCSNSGFFEQLFPLVRAINQKLPAAKRLRVLAGDPPIDWEQVKTGDEARRFLNRDPNIASVMVKEVLAKHRKALMLFGTFHLMHGNERGAVSMYEKDYPGRTFVIGNLGIYDTNRRDGSRSPFASWPNPSLAQTKGTWLGALSLSDIWPPPIRIDADCKVTIGFPPHLQQPMGTMVDAFLYLGPQEFQLDEPMPADIALDTEYMAELRRRDALMGFPGDPLQSQKEINEEIMQGAREPLLEEPPPSDAKDIEQTCLARKKQSGQ